jgi:glyoxylase-like metal-dependent hydrolase (beta-lactamase superfamily II)
MPRPITEGNDVTELQVLCDGYVRDGDELRVGSTVGFVRDGDALVVIDPGMVAGAASILDPLLALGVTPIEVTDVVLSHHHPDHTLNAGLFPGARVHDFQAIYLDDLWIDRPAEGFQLSPNVTLIETPGHTPQDITTLVTTERGVVGFTHLWWAADGPADDPYTHDAGALHANRERVLGLASEIVPGHGPRFVPDETTPR